QKALSEIGGHQLQARRVGELQSVGLTRVQHSHKQGRHRDPAQHVEARQRKDYDLEDAGNDGQHPALAVDSPHAARIAKWSVGASSVETRSMPLRTGAPRSEEHTSELQSHLN